MSWEEEARELMALLKEDGFDPPDIGYPMKEALRQVINYIHWLRSKVNEH